MQTTVSKWTKMRIQFYKFEMFFEIVSLKNRKPQIFGNPTLYRNYSEMKFQNYLQIDLFTTFYKKNVR